MAEEPIEPADPLLETTADGELEAGKFCPVCGLVNPDANTHCYNCGSPLDAEIPIEVESSAKHKQRESQYEEIRAMLTRRFDAHLPPNLFYVHRYAPDNNFLQELTRVPGRIELPNVVLVPTIGTMLFTTACCAASAMYPHDSDLAQGSAIIILCIIMIIGAGLILLFNARKRQYEGQIKLFFGEITASRLAHEYFGSSSEASLEVEFKFTTGPLMDTVGTARAIRSDLRGRPTPAAGTPVAVIVYPDHEYWVL